MHIRMMRLTEDAVLPTKAHRTDAGFDLTATRVVYDQSGCATCHTGIAMEIPEGYVGLIFPRSSIYRTDLHLTNCVGVIDAGYRGEVTLKFKPTSRFIAGYGLRQSPGRCPEAYKAGERVGQLIVMKLPDVEVVESTYLSEGERGQQGYGSTGR